MRSLGVDIKTRKPKRYVLYEAFAKKEGYRNDSISEIQAFRIESPMIIWFESVHDNFIWIEAEAL